MRKPKAAEQVEKNMMLISGTLVRCKHRENLAVCYSFCPFSTGWHVNAADTLPPSTA